MKVFFLVLIASVVVPNLTQANTLTYAVDITSGGDSLTGTISTDGTIGTLSSSNITGFDLTMSFVPTAPANYSGPSPLTATETYSKHWTTVGGSEFTATSSGLFFDFGSTATAYAPPDFEAAYVDFASPPNSDLEFLDSRYSPGAIDLTDVVDGQPVTGTIFFNDLTEIGTITTTPLPAALPLFATGLGGLGLLGWRRKRNNVGIAA
jgi:hypothetical protein